MALSKARFIPGVEHGPKGYKLGCECDICIKSKPGRKPGQQSGTGLAARAARADAAPPPADDRLAALRARLTPGPVEQAVMDELAAADGAQGISALSEVALTLAREVDCPPNPLGSSASAASTLLRYLQEIRKAGTQVDDELASLIRGLGDPA